MASSPEPISMLNQPLSSLREETFIKLCCNLTTASFRERSWKGLGGRIGLNAGQVDLLNKHQESDKGWLLLKTWENLDKSGATVKRLIVALESLQMRSCINVIQDDTSISDEDTESAQNECAQLIESGKLTKYFPTHSTVQFHKALYPHHHHERREPSLPAQPPFPPQHLVQAFHHNETKITEELSQTHKDIQSVTDKPRFERKSVFISYCPETCEADPTLTNRLTNLVQTLRDYGYNVYYDKCSSVEIQRCGGLDLWKESYIRRAENILVICTPEYFQEDERALMENKNSRIEVDRKMLRAITYSSDHDRLIPVKMDEYRSSVDCVPSFVQALPLHFWPSKERDLLFCLAREAPFKLEEVRVKKVLTPTVIRIPQRKDLPNQRVIQQPARPKQLSSKTMSHAQSHDKKESSKSMSHDKKGPSKTMSHDKKGSKESSKTQSHDKQGRKRFGFHNIFTNKIK